MKPLILCVDDEKIVLDALRVQLKTGLGREYAIEFAESAAEGFELIDAFRRKGADVAVTIADFLMPGMKGDEFLIKVHQDLPATTKILLTGQIGFEGLTKVVSRINLYRYIAKPWDNTDLILTVREAANSFMQGKIIKAQLEELKNLNQQMEEINRTLEMKVEARTQELAEQRRIFRQLFENSPDAIVICDPEGKIVDSNPAFTALFQYSAAAIAGGGLMDTVFSESVAETERVCQALASGRAFNGEMKLRRKNRTAVTAAVTGYPYETSRGGQGMFLICRDLTEQRKTEKLLRLSYERHRRNDFFNDIINGRISNPETAVREVSIDLQQPLAVYFMAVVEWRGKPFLRALVQNNEEKMLVDAMIDQLGEEPGITAWDAYQGIGIIHQKADYSPFSRDEEIVAATALREKLAGIFPDVAAVIGIAAFEPGLEHFVRRYRQAHDAAITGSQVWPDEGVYHYLDGGAFPLLAGLAGRQDVDAFLARTIDKIIAHDQKKGSELFRTLEQIVTTDNLRIVAKKMYLHYKTVLFRKQAIEKLLGVSMDSFKGRLLVGTALTLHYLREKNGNRQ